MMLRLVFTIVNPSQEEKVKVFSRYSRKIPHPKGLTYTENKTGRFEEFRKCGHEGTLPPLNMLDEYVDGGALEHEL